MDDLIVGRYRVPDTELEEVFSTSGGPGGQHANRSQTAVEIRFDVSASEAFPAAVRDRIVTKLGALVVVTSAESRSQWRNRALARQALAARLEEATRVEKPRRRTRPTRASKRRRLDAKRRQSEKKQMRRRPGPGDIS